MLSASTARTSAAASASSSTARPAPSFSKFTYGLSTGMSPGAADQPCAPGGTSVIAASTGTSAFTSDATCSRPSRTDQYSGFTPTGSRAR